MLLTISKTNPSPGALGMSNLFPRNAFCSVDFGAIPLAMAIITPAEEVDKFKKNFSAYISNLR